MTGSIDTLASLTSPPSLRHMGIIFREPPATGPLYLSNLWSINLYDYEGSVTFNGINECIKPGFAAILPPSTQRTFFVEKRSCHRHAAFSIPEDTPAGKLDPVMVDIGPACLRLFEQFDEAVGIFPIAPSHAAVKLWDIILHICAAPRVAGALTPAMHPALVKAVGIIERHLQDRLYIPELASEVGLSHNHLTRLFRASFQATVAGYIRSRRVRAATRLLLDSTLQVKVIAVEVGIPDIQLFNKIMRRETGCAPTQLRERNAKR